MSPTKVTAIIPAAGYSRRMGEPKLLLDWKGRPLIWHLIEELRAASVDPILVVTRRDDRVLNTLLCELGVTVISPECAPPDMRRSVEYGLELLVSEEGGNGSESSDSVSHNWLLIPADHPLVRRQTVSQLMAASRSEREILIPTFEGRRGHPTLFSGHFVQEVARIPEDAGINWLVRHYAAAVREIPVTDPGILVDLDTPEDYQRLLQSFR